MQFSVRGGRVIRFGPRWPESDATVVFDVSSGDYWVLDFMAHSMVEELWRCGPLGEEALRARMPSAGSAGSAAAVAWSQSLEAVIDAGLLQRLEVQSAGQVPPR